MNVNFIEQRILFYMVCFYIVFNVILYSLTDLSFLPSINGFISKSLTNLQEDIAWSALVKLFDPVKSPRCYAVIALKQQQ